MSSRENIGRESPLSPRAGRYPDTQWSIVRAAGKGNESALNQLCQSYWFPVFGAFYDRTKNHHDAEDLTQRLFFELFRRDDLVKLHEDKGLFRAFLKAVVHNLHSNFVEERTSQKRGGKSTPISIDHAWADGLLKADEEVDDDPSTSFDRRWFLVVIERAKLQLKGVLTEEGKSLHFEAFEEHLLPSEAQIPYSEIATQLEVTEGNSRVLLFRMRKRFREIVLLNLLETVENQSQAQEELNYLSALIGIKFPKRTGY